jgi:uncharacterized protein with HEPN domain
VSDRDRAYLLDIQASIRLIEEYCRGGEAEFLTAQFLQDAVIRRLEIIGESAKRLSIELRSSKRRCSMEAGLRSARCFDP